MIRRACILALVCAACACAQAAGSPQETDVDDFFRQLAAALDGGKPAALWLLFDPAMPGYKQFRADSDALMNGNRLDTVIGMVKNEGDDRARTVQLDWRMQIDQQERFTSTTHRNAGVKCRLEKRENRWRIVSFAPMTLFAPVHAGEAWDELISAVGALTNRPIDGSPVNPSWFFRSVDPAMPGVEKLRASLTALLRRGEMESSLDLISNEGDDQTRTLVVDWSLQVLNDQTQITAMHKEQQVQLRMTWQGKHWRIVALDPLNFFE